MTNTFNLVVVMRNQNIKLGFKLNSKYITNIYIKICVVVLPKPLMVNLKISLKVYLKIHLKIHVKLLRL